jgi:hypothetical protein
VKAFAVLVVSGLVLLAPSGASTGASQVGSIRAGSSNVACEVFDAPAPAAICLPWRTNGPVSGSYGFAVTESGVSMVQAFPSGLRDFGDYFQPHTDDAAPDLSRYTLVPLAKTRTLKQLVPTNGDDLSHPTGYTDGALHTGFGAARVDGVVWLYDLYKPPNPDDVASSWLTSVSDTAARLNHFLPDGSVDLPIGVYPQPRGTAPKRK